MIGYLVDVEFVWGFQSKVVGYSKTSPSFHYPPPTSFLGAMAESIAKENSLGENRGRNIIGMLSNNLLALGVKPLNCSPIKFSDLNRLIAIKITGGKLFPSPEDPSRSFDAPASGRTILSTRDSEPPKLRYYVVLSSRVVGHLKDTELTIDKGTFWRIHRLGSKESIVSIIDVQEFEPDAITGIVTTTYSFPLVDGIKLDYLECQRWVQEQLIDPFKIQTYDPVSHYLLAQNTIKYLLPIIEMPENPPAYRVQVANSARAYSHGEEVVVGVWMTK